MTEIPAHLLKRAQERRHKAATEAHGAPEQPRWQDPLGSLSPGNVTQPPNVHPWSTVLMDPERWEVLVLQADAVGMVGTWKPANEIPEPMARALRVCAIGVAARLRET